MDLKKGPSQVHVEANELQSSIMHQGVENLQAKFEEAEAHRRPVFMIFDEIDYLMPKIEASSIDNRPVYNDRRANILQKLEKAGEKNIFVIGTTNKPPKELDEASTRRGRIDVKVEVKKPDKVARKELFRMYLNDAMRDGKSPVSSSDMRKLADLTESFSVSEIIGVCQDAALEALDVQRELNLNDVLNEIAKIKK